ncbi:MAG: hypothetical protein U0573_11170 [Phycisphaerales bacterium]
MIRLAFFLSCVCSYLSLGADPAMPAQSAGPPTREALTLSLDPEEQRKLLQIDSRRPQEYLELAEDLLDRPDSQPRLELARDLLVRAIEYGRVLPENRRVASSAAAALATLCRRPSDQLWLRAIATVLQPGDAPLPQVSAKPLANQAAEAKASMVLTLIRAGEGTEVTELLRDDAVRAILVRHESELSADGTLTVTDIENEAKKWPCPECSNAGIITPPKSQHAAAKICPVCAGNPGLKLSPESLGAQLRLQRRLQSDAPESWGSQLATQTAPPARDPDPASVAIVFGVDARKSVWREGVWISPADAKPENP